MGLKSSFIYTLLFGFLWLIASCDMVKKPESSIKITFTPDTLNVGYTYWWPQSGPFMGNCGDELSLVFTGIVRQLEAPTNDAGPLYNSQKGIIALEQVFKIKDLGENTYTSQKYFRSDCFDGLDIAIGDTVLVTCYDYDNRYSIPGGKSVLKVNSFEDPLIISLKKYINAKQNPVKIKGDSLLWSIVGLESDLKQIVACREESVSDSLNASEH